LGNDSNYTTAMGSVALNNGDTVRVQGGYGHGGVAGALYRYTGHGYTTHSGSVNLTSGDIVRLADDYGNGGEKGAVYQYTGSNAQLDLGTQDYSKGPWQKLDLGTQDYSTGPWQVVTTNLNTEDYSNTSRWMKLTTITATAVAASLAVGGAG